MKALSFSSLLALLFCLACAPVTRAGTINIPVSAPLMTVDIPESWEPEETDNGVVCETPDKEATIFFEVTSAKKIEALTEESIDWLQDQDVTIDKSTEKTKEFKAGGLDWSLVSWDGKNDEFGPATIMLAFADAGKGKVILVTYWVTKKGESKYEGELTKIFDSVRKAGK